MTLAETGFHLVSVIRSVSGARSRPRRRGAASTRSCESARVELDAVMPDHGGIGHRICRARIRSTAIAPIRDLAAARASRSRRLRRKRVSRPAAEHPSSGPHPNTFHAPLPKPASHARLPHCGAIGGDAMKPRRAASNPRIDLRLISSTTFRVMEFFRATPVEVDTQR